LAAIATYPLVLHLRTAIPGADDAFQFYWNLWWVKRALVVLHVNPYAIGDLYFPYGAHLYFHTLNLLQDVIALPIALLLGLPAAYNFVVFLSFMLSGYAVYRLSLYVLEQEVDPGGLVVHAGAARHAAFVAGAAFAFSSYRCVHLLGHLDLLSTQWLPLFVLFALKTRRERGWRNPACCGLFLAATALTSAYYGAFLLVFAGLLIVFAAAGRGREWRSATGRIVGALLISGVLLSPLLVTMLSLGRTEGRTSNPAYDIDRFSADVLAFVVPSPLHPLWGRVVEPAYRVIARGGSGLEAVMFLGYVPLLLALAGVKAFRARTWRFWVAGCVLFSVLALGPIVHVAGRAVAPGFSRATPYRLFARLPYGDIPRVPGRFVVMTTLCLSPLVAGGAWVLLRRLTGAPALGIAALMTASIVFENAVVPLPLSEVRVPPFFDRLGGDTSRTGVIEVPIPDDPAEFPQRMLWQTVHGQPLFGGYLSRSVPPLPFDAVPGFAQFKTRSGAIDDVVSYDARQLPAISLAVLGAYSAGHLVIEKRLIPPADGQRAREIADALFGPSARRYDDAFTLAYAIPRARDLVLPALWLDTGWSYLERSADGDGAGRTVRWRWMGERARLGIVASQPARVRLHLAAQAFGHVRRIRIGIGGSEIATLPVTDARSEFTTPWFQIDAGSRFLELRSLDGAASPGADPRRLSVAVFDLELLTER